MKLDNHYIQRILSVTGDSDDCPFSELRIQSMSIGLGQIMGFSYKRVGALFAKI